MKLGLQKYARRLKTRKVGVIAGGLVVGFIGLNLVVYAAFANRTFPNTRIASYSIGATSYNAIAKKVGSLPLLPTSITLNQHDHSSSLTPAQLGIKINDTQIEAAARTRSWLPLENFFATHKLPVAIKVDQAAMSGKLAAIALSDKQDPVDAHITMQNSQFQLAGSINGYQLDTAAAANVITQAIRQNKRAVDLPFDNVMPKVSNASVLPTLQQLQAQQAVSLSYTYNGKTIRPSAATVASWYSLVNNSYALDDTKIQAYVNQIGASNNIQVQNLSAALAATQTAIQKTSAMTFALVAVPPSACSSNARSQLILVSISQQHMWACQGPEEVYDTPVTTGAYQVGDDTPTGTWHIYAKETDTHLIGPTWDDFVNYWLPFYSDYGFHDATWQTFPFGGPEYPTEGSHGCVHLPLAAMAWLYNWAEVGTTVTINQ